MHRRLPKTFNLAHLSRKLLLLGKKGRRRTIHNARRSFNNDPLPRYSQIQKSKACHIRFPNMVNLWESYYWTRWSQKHAWPLGSPFARSWLWQYLRPYLYPNEPERSWLYFKTLVFRLASNPFPLLTSQYDGPFGDHFSLLWFNRVRDEGLESKFSKVFGYLHSLRLNIQFTKEDFNEFESPDVLSEWLFKLESTKELNLNMKLFMCVPSRDMNYHTAYKSTQVF